MYWNKWRPKASIGKSVQLDASWEMEDTHDDLLARVVNTMGVPVYLYQFFVQDRKQKGSPAKLNIFSNEGKKASLATALQRCNEGASGGARAEPLLTKRKEKLRETSRVRRTAKTKPVLSLGGLCTS